MMTRVTMGTRQEVLAAEAAAKLTGVKLLNCELYSCGRGDRKYRVDDRLELHDLQEYPDLNGEVVTVTGYRKSDGDLNGYYIKSDSGNVEPWLNFVWEKRLRPVVSIFGKSLAGAKFSKPGSRSASPSRSRSPDSSAAPEP